MRCMPHLLVGFPEPTYLMPLSLSKTRIERNSFSHFCVKDLAKYSSIYKRRENYLVVSVAYGIGIDPLNKASFFHAFGII